MTSKDIFDKSSYIKLRRYHLMKYPLEFIFRTFKILSCSLAHLSHGYNLSYGNICSYCFHANSRVGESGKYFPTSPTLSRREWKVLSVFSYSWGLRDMQPSPISLLIKRDLVIFERVPLARPGIEPGSLHTTVECLTTWATQATVMLWLFYYT